MDFIITKNWLLKNATKKGGWTKAQLNALGYSEPFKGWQDKLIGKAITKQAKKAFENGKEVYAKNKKNKEPNWLRKMQLEFPDFKIKK